MKVLMQVCIVLAAFVVTTSVASAAVVRVNYDYVATGIGTGQGLWSVTIDSGLIWAGDAYEEAGDDVTFIAAMATPVFKQRDTLFAGDVIPGTPGLVGWANDDSDNGLETGMEWKFYESTDTVTLYAVTEDYRDYTWDIETKLAFSDVDDAGGTNRYYYHFRIADNPDGLDATDNDENKWRGVSWWGDVDVFEGHRHSGTRYEYFSVGPDVFIEGRDGYLDEDAGGDGIGVSLGLRKTRDGDASVFLSDVFFGGDVFADTSTIPEPATIALLGLGLVALRRRKRA